MNFSQTRLTNNIFVMTRNIIVMFMIHVRKLERNYSCSKKLKEILRSSFFSNIPHSTFRHFSKLRGETHALNATESPDAMSSSRTHVDSFASEVIPFLAIGVRIQKTAPHSEETAPHGKGQSGRRA